MWTIIIVVLIIVIVSFLSSVNKDNKELSLQPMHDKFEIIIAMLNDAAFQGNGEVKLLTNKELTIYQNGENQIIRLHYSTGHLLVIWKYKYYQKEMVYNRQFNDVRNLSIFEQQKIGETIIIEASRKIEAHKMDVLDF